MMDDTFRFQLKDAASGGVHDVVLDVETARKLHRDLGAALDRWAADQAAKADAGERGH